MNVRKWCDIPCVSVTINEEGGEKKCEKKDVEKNTREGSVAVLHTHKKTLTKKRQESLFSLSLSFFF